jgi:formylglycine-generating enzyme required for sulfatase activity
MVEIPAGSFLMGAEDEELAIVDSIEETDLPEGAFYWLINEQPKHEVFIDSFQIDKFELTNKAYLQCVKATVCTPPNNSFYPDPSFEDWPVTHVNWEQANVYCQWSESRLPTEAEWEKAARYGYDTPDQLYAWGNTITDERANVFVGIIGSPMPVGSFSPTGDTASGLADMTGNVWDWVADWYGEDYYNYSAEANPLGPVDGHEHVARGGSYDNDWVQARITYRKSDFRTGDSASHLGFRCVRPSK